MSQSYGPNWEQSRQAALARDNRRCQDCGRRHDLHVHHVEPIRTFDEPEDANYLDNLVTLCKYCHPEWEGRGQRPELADPSTQTSLTGVVNEWVYDTVFRHSLTAAAPEIYYRWFKSNPGCCSRCLSQIGHVRTDHFHRFTRYIEAVVQHQRELPSGAVQQRSQVAEDYCPDCKRGADNKSSKNIKDSKAYRVRSYLEKSGYRFEDGLVAQIYTSLRGTPPVPSENDTESAIFQRVVAGLFGVPLTVARGVTYDFAVPDRRIDGEIRELESMGGKSNWYRYVDFPD